MADHFSQNGWLNELLPTIAPGSCLSLGSKVSTPAIPLGASWDVRCSRAWLREKTTKTDDCSLNLKDQLRDSSEKDDWARGSGSHWFI